MITLVWEWLLVYLVLGAGVGLIAGLLGVGGGAIMVPVFTTLFQHQGLPADEAILLALGTSMASIVVTSLSSMRAHHRHGAVLWDTLKHMAPGILFGTFAATFLVPYIGGEYLAIIFTLFIAYVSVQMILNKKPRPGRTLPGGAGLAAVGSGIGGFSALVSIGGGTLTTPFLIWHNVPVRSAIGTSAAAGVPISLAGTLGYLLNDSSRFADMTYVQGFVYLPAVLCVSIGSFFFAPMGARLAHRLPVATVKKLFAIMLVLLCADMAWSIYQAD